MREIGLYALALALAACQAVRADVPTASTRDFNHPFSLWLPPDLRIPAQDLSLPVRTLRYNADNEPALHPRVKKSTPLGISDLTDCSELIIVATFAEYETCGGWITSSGPIRHPGESFYFDVTDFGTVKVARVLKGNLPNSKALPVLLPHQELTTASPAQFSLVTERVLPNPAVPETPDPHVGTTHLLFL